MLLTSKKSQLAPALTIRQLFQLVRNPIKQLPVLIREYPDAFRPPFTAIETYIVQNPEYVKHILHDNYLNYTKGAKYGILKPMLGNGLLLSEGATWRKHRLLAQPAFHRKRLEPVAEIAADATEKLMHKWKDKATIDFTNEMGYLTIEIVSKALFGTAVSDKVDDIRESIRKLNRTVSLLARFTTSKSNWVMNLPYTSGLNKAMKVLDDLIYGIINERRLSHKTYDDLLSMLMEARYEDTGEAMNDQQLRDELITLFIAGHETTVLSLSWTAYLLAQHPNVVDKIRAELNATINNRTPLFSDLPQLKYLTNVMNESMRLYPPIYVIGRKAVKEDFLGEFRVPANYNVGINIYSLHRHPKYWDNPDSFKPERFENFDIKGDNRFLFLPFGGGPRTCIGNNFAMMEMLIITSMLLQRFDIELVSGKSIPQAQFTLAPTPSISLKLFVRQSRVIAT